MENNIIKRINLHLGAHKTATTYIQKVLRVNKDRLLSHGIKYIPMQNVRRNITKAIRVYRNRGVGRTKTVTDIRDFINERFPEDCHTLVLSEENLVGNCREIYFKADLYPDAEERLRLLAEALPACEINVFFSVRQYVDFLPSAYCEFLRHNDFITFEEFIGRLDLDGEFWVRAVNAIVSVFGRENVHVWPYGRFRGNSVRIMAELVSSADIRLSTGVKEARPSLSDRSVRALYRLSKELSPAEVRVQVRAMTDAYPKSEENTGFMPWNEGQRLFWEGKYESELVHLRHDGLVMELD